MNWANPDIPYQLSSKDILSLNILFKATYAIDIKVVGEKGIPQSSKLFMITAPAMNNTNYTGTGFTLEEAVKSWFSRIEEIREIERSKTME